MRIARRTTLDERKELPTRSLRSIDAATTLAETCVFGPELIEELSRECKVPKNFMFIGSPGTHFPFRLADLGGVRLII